MKDIEINTNYVTGIATFKDGKHTWILNMLTSEVAVSATLTKIINPYTGKVKYE